MRRIIVGFVPILVLSLPATAPAATRYVTTIGSDNPSCTQASPCRTIAHAVTIAIAGDTIQIAKGLYAETGGVVIDKNLVLNGVGSVSTRVKGSWTASVFRIQAGANVQINGMMIRNGSGIRGGGIHNEGSVSLNGVRVWQNRATYGGGIANYSNAALYMTDCEIAVNDAENHGAGLHNEGYASLSRTRIIANHGGIGGGIMNTETATLYLQESLVDGNTDHGIFNLGDATVTNTTLSHNRPIAVYTSVAGQSVLTHLTIADNGDQSGFAGGVLIGGEVTIRNTLLTGNTGSNCGYATGGTLLSPTGNLDSDNSCQFFSWSNLIGLDPKIGPLKSNGGFSQTYALLKGSPAIDGADQAYCELVDQRGVLRVIDGDGDGTPACDIGAFEYSPYRRIDQVATAGRAEQPSALRSTGEGRTGRRVRRSPEAPD